MKIGKTKKNCVICVKPFEKGEKIYRVLKCSHIYHKDCFEPWLVERDSCPMCRESLIPEAIVKQSTETEFNYESTLNFQN